jgi:hypothetical protein
MNWKSPSTLVAFPAPLLAATAALAQGPPPSSPEAKEKMHALEFMVIAGARWHLAMGDPETR